MWLFGRGESGTQVPTCVGDITPIQRSSRETGVLRWGGGLSIINVKLLDRSVGLICTGTDVPLKSTVHMVISLVLNSTTIIIMAIV